MSRFSSIPSAFLLLSACDPVIGSDAPAGFIVPTGTSCGLVETCDAEGESDGPDVDARDCLVNAAASCEAAYATIVQYTIEGGPITATWQVAPDGAGGCEIQVTTDMTQDPYRGEDYAWSTCSTITVRDDTCPSMGSDDCVRL